MKNYYQNVAVALDFSQPSLAALERATEVAKQHGATLHLVSIVDNQSFGSIAAYDLTYADELLQERNKEVSQLKEKIVAAGVANVQIHVETGSPKKILTEYPADLLIVGATGLSRMEKAMLGSVSEKVVRHAVCDVLVVRA